MQEQNDQPPRLEETTQEQPRTDIVSFLDGKNNVLVVQPANASINKIHPFFSVGKINPNLPKSTTKEKGDQNEKERDYHDSKPDPTQKTKKRRKTKSTQSVQDEKAETIQDVTVAQNDIKDAKAIDIENPPTPESIECMGTRDNENTTNSKAPRRKRRKLTQNDATTTIIPFVLSPTTSTETSALNTDIPANTVPTSSPPQPVAPDDILVRNSSPLPSVLPLALDAEHHTFPPSSDIVIIESEPNDPLAYEKNSRATSTSKQSHLSFAPTSEVKFILKQEAVPTIEKAKPRRNAHRSVSIQGLPKLELCPSPSSVRQRASRSKNTRKVLVVLKLSALKLSTLLTNLSLDGKHKQEGPLKTVHPFFSRKLDQAAQPEVLQTNSSDSNSQREHPEDAGEKQAFLKFALSGPKSLASIPRAKWQVGIEAPWPLSDSVHVRALDLDDSKTIEQMRKKKSGLFETRRKDKSKPNYISTEDSILVAIARRFDSSKSTKLHAYNSASDDHVPSSVRIPDRFELSATTIMKRYLRPALSTRMTSNNMHLALQSLRDRIGRCDQLLTAFDQGKCESKSWITKYAPSCSAEVLQPGKEPLILREWLGRMKVWAVEGAAPGSNTKKVPKSGKDLLRRKKKKRRRPDDLNDFLISEDEDEGSCMDELTDPEDEVQMFPGTSIVLDNRKSVVRHGELLMPSSKMESGDELDGELVIPQYDHSIKVMNTILLSGPHGVGKTASIYAAAQEHGFTVFEVHAGAKRGGKEVLEMVGDMTRNHLVHQNKDRPEPHVGAGMNSFFQQKGAKGARTLGESAAASSKQKQSLILIEEADLLYEEDKQFWTTMLTLIANSKRPVVITCNDETLLPLDILPLHAILRYNKPPVELAVDYLLLILAAEGHILDRSTVQTLFEECHGDLRKCIMQLDFWCQMTVGDRTGGTKWWVKRWPLGADIDEDGEVLRCVSKGTMATRMGTFGRDLMYERFDPDSQVASVRDDVLWGDIYETMGIDVGEKLFEDMEELLDDLPKSLDSTHMLDEYFKFVDALSAVDIYAGKEVRRGSPFEEFNSLNVLLDTTQRPMSAKERSDLVLGHKSLQTDVVPLYNNTERSIAMYVRSISSNLLQKRVLVTKHSPKKVTSRAETPSASVDKFASLVLDRQKMRPGIQLTRYQLLHPFDYLAQVDMPFAITPPNLFNSQLLRPRNLVVAEITPYVREIARHDVMVQEQRKLASTLMSEGGDATKRRRTTRAAVSAAEGRRRRGGRGTEEYLKGNVKAMIATAGASWGIAVQTAIKDTGAIMESGNTTSDDDDDEDNRPLHEHTVPATIPMVIIDNLIPQPSLDDKIL